jgi:hypothetical protein
MPECIHKGSSRVPWIDRSIRLNHWHTVDIAPNGANDPRRNGLIESEWASNCYGCFANLRGGAVAEDGRREIVGIYRDHGYVSWSVRSNDRSNKQSSVRDANVDDVDVVDNVSCREDEAVGRVDDA